MTDQKSLFQVIWGCQEPLSLLLLSQEILVIAGAKVLTYEILGDEELYHKWLRGSRSSALLYVIMRAENNCLGDSGALGDCTSGECRSWLKFTIIDGGGLGRST